MADSQPVPVPEAGENSASDANSASEKVVHQLPADRSQAFAQALAMSRQMLALAKDAQWQQLIDLEASRQQALLESFPTSAGDPAHNRLAADSLPGQQIQEILQIDEQVQQLVAAERNAIRDELAARSRAQSQAKAYQAP